MPEEIKTLRRAGHHDNIALDVLCPNLPITASALSGGSHSTHNSCLLLGAVSAIARCCPIPRSWPSGT